MTSIAPSFHSTVLPQYSRASSVQLDEYDDSKHSLWEADVGVSRFVPSNGGRDVSITSGGTPLSLHIYKAGSGPVGLLSNDQVVKADDKETVLYRLHSPRSLKGWSIEVYPAVSPSGSPDPVCTVEKGSFGFSSTDIKVTLNSGWSSVLHSTGIYSTSRDFAGMPGLNGAREGDDAGKFRWETATNEAGSSKGAFSSEIQCMDLGSRDVVAIWRRTGWAAKKSGELKINKKYASQVTLILATALAVEEWRKEQAVGFKTVHTM